MLQKPNPEPSRKVWTVDPLLRWFFCKGEFRFWGLGFQVQGLGFREYMYKVVRLKRGLEGSLVGMGVGRHREIRVCLPPKAQTQKPKP